MPLHDPDTRGAGVWIALVVVGALALLSGLGGLATDAATDASVPAPVVVRPVVEATEGDGVDDPDDEGGADEDAVDGPDAPDDGDDGDDADEGGDESDRPRRQAPPATPPPSDDGNAPRLLEPDRPRAAGRNPLLEA